VRLLVGIGLGAVAAVEIRSMNEKQLIILSNLINAEQRRIGNVIELARGLEHLAALTNYDYDILATAFIAWVKTEPLSWREGLQWCESRIRVGAPLPFVVV